MTAAPATVLAPSGAFKSAHATGPDWQTTVTACMAALGELPRGANLGFLYVTDALAEDLPAILSLLRMHSGIESWVGSVGMGIAGNGAEYYERPAIALLVGALPADSFRLFDPVTGPLEDFQSAHQDWIAAQQPLLGVVHGDPRNRDLTDIIEAVAAASGSYLVGGLSSAQGEMPQVAGTVTEGGLSGVLFASDRLVVAGLTQGCTPIGPRRVITDGAETLIRTIDDRPALEVLKEDIGELLARDLQRIGGYIFVSFPIAGSDTGDYLVRNLIGMDPERGLLQVGETVTPGQAITFCRRDHDAAQEDLDRMLRDVTKRCDRPPQAALYFSCLARGRHLFGDDSEELKQLRGALGDIPLAGFFANGEISNNRLYGYTGVLALLL